MVAYPLGKLQGTAGPLLTIKGCRLPQLTLSRSEGRRLPPLTLSLPKDRPAMPGFPGKIEPPGEFFYTVDATARLCYHPCWQ